MEFSMQSFLAAGIVLDLINRSKNGFIPFSAYDGEDRTHYIVYDDTAGSIENDGCEIVLDMCHDVTDYDIVSHICDSFNGISFKVHQTDDACPYVEISDGNGSLIIEDGKCRVSSY